MVSKIRGQPSLGMNRAERSSGPTRESKGPEGKHAPAFLLGDEVEIVTTSTPHGKTVVYRKGRVRWVTL